jgi:HAD superfamily phosphatase
MTSRSAIVVFDIDGVVRDVGGSYRRALADTVEHYTSGAFRPSQLDIDALKSEGIWNNDWEASQELVYRYFEAQGQTRSTLAIDYEQLVAFFQARYRGPDPIHWTGYICDEPLLMSADYVEQLTQAQISWGFFSGATTGSARYVLETRIGLQDPILVAMEDAPGKPDPTGLLETICRIEGTIDTRTPVLYVGDTVADMYTVENARQIHPDRPWFAVGILPPHVQESVDRQTRYAEALEKAGAQIIFNQVEALTPNQIWTLVGKE